MSSRRVPSKAVHHGRNNERVAFRDDRYVRCSRCNHVTHLDRHTRASWGSRAGQGISHPDPLTYDEALQFNTNDQYNGQQSDFTITGGCPFCGSYTFDREARTHG